MITENDIRLLTVASFVRPGARVYDIGSDHGYLPIHLINRGLAERVRAVENKPGPFSRLQANVAPYPEIEALLADGMDRYEPEFDTVIAAGLGGTTIIRVLKKYFMTGVVAPSRIILEPQSDAQRVREFLNDCRYRIEDEKYVEDRGKIYPVIVWVPGLELLQTLDLLYGPCALKNRDPLLKKYLERQLIIPPDMPPTVAAAKKVVVQEALKAWKK